ncbi:MFS transporter [Streptobacillus moniliformis]|uniref:MFS transporter n=1 Tax=Streptobacillus moniliformis TaxID=34105 RepID=UPI0009B5A564|nr:MFS transporter [Streptobacillus moniliformis]AVL43445.1 MFS transporter [Streptobacillus moniliformis]
MQSFFSLAILLFEFPSGIWADKYSRKFLYLLSNILVIITFILIYKFSSLYILALAWFIYGFYEATISGTLDAQIINDIKNEDETLLNKFIKTSQQIMFIGMMMGSVLGSFLYFKIGFKIYLLGALFIAFSFFIILLFFKNNQKSLNENVKIKIHLFQVINELKVNENLRIYIFLCLVSQIYFQTHFQLWQALFLTKGIKQENLYIYYILFQLIGFISYYFPIEKAKNNMRYIYFSFSVLIIIPLIILSNNKYLVIVIYLLICSIFTILDYFIIYNFSKIVSKENISSLISLKSTSSRIASLIMLILFSFILKFVSLQYLIISNFTIVFAILLISIFKFHNKLFNENMQLIFGEVKNALLLFFNFRHLNILQYLEILKKM